LDVVFEKALSRRSTNRIVNSFASSPPQPNPACTRRLLNLPSSSFTTGSEGDVTYRPSTMNLKYNLTHGSGMAVDQSEPSDDRVNGTSDFQPSNDPRMPTFAACSPYNVVSVNS